MITRALTTLLLCLLVSASFEAQGQGLDPDVEKILRERLVVLRETAKLQREAHRIGAAALTAIVETDKTVLDAELELAATKAERVRVREEMLKIAETLETTVSQLAKANEAPHVDMLRARANRLRAAADLALERKTAP